MAHKKYIKKDGKVFGPYFYENKRVGGKVVTSYIGKSNSEKSGKIKVKRLGLCFLILALLALGLFFFVPFFQDNLDSEEGVLLSPEDDGRVENHLASNGKTKDLSFIHSSGTMINVLLSEEGIVLNRDIAGEASIELDEAKVVSEIILPSGADLIDLDFEEVLEETEIVNSSKNGNASVIGNVTGNVSDDNISFSPESEIVIDLSNELEEGEIVEIGKNVNSIKIEYSIPGPQIIQESEISGGKRIVVSGEGKDVLVYFDISDFNIENPEDAESLRVFWVEEQRELDKDISFDMNGVVDKVWFVVPGLSEQTFDITFNSSLSMEDTEDDSGEEGPAGPGGPTSPAGIKNPLINFSFPTPDHGSSVLGSFAVNVSSWDAGSNHYTFLNLNRDLRLWMRFDDVDNSNNPLDISTYGTQWLRQGNAIIDNDGYWGNGSSFSNSGDYFVSSGNDVWAEEDFANGHTISAWVNPRDYSSNFLGAYIFDSEGKISLLIEKETERASYRMSGNKLVHEVKSDNPISLNTWTHIVGVWNGSLSLYVDGVKQQETQISELGYLDETSMPTFIGTDVFFFDFLDGQMDDILIFNRSLNNREVLALHDAAPKQNQYYNFFGNLAPGNYEFRAHAVNRSGNRNMTWEDENVEERLVIVGSGSAVGLSQTLSGGIIWDIPSPPVVDEPADGNNGIGVTDYYVDISSTLPVDLCIKAEGDLISQNNDVLPLDNEKYSFSLSDNTVTGQPKISLTTNYVNAVTNIVGNQRVYFKFFLDASQGQPAGQYTNNVLFDVSPSSAGCP